MNTDAKHIESLWAETYPAGMARTLPPPANSSIQAMWKDACLRYADQIAYSMGPIDMSYAELEERSIQFASWLRKTSGFAPSDRVAIMLPNVLHYPIVLLGSLRSGAIVVNVNPQYTERELTHQLKDSGATVIVISEALTSLLTPCLGETAICQVVVVPQDFSFTSGSKNKKQPDFSQEHIHVNWTSFSDVLMAMSNIEWEDVNADPGDVAFLQYTGGTTGVSKGAILTHGNILSNIDQAQTWFASRLTEGEEAVLTALPLYHIFALTANCLLFAKYGARNILVPNPRNLDALLGYFQRGEVTVLTGVNTLFNVLVHATGFDQFDFSRINLVVGGGAAVQKVVAEKWLKVTGIPIVEGYGLTEASPFVTCNLLQQGFTGTIGVPIPSTLVEIRNDNGQKQVIGKEGEICIKGPQVMKGYWQRPEETAAVFDGDGWLKTGDVGFVDQEGFITITDRIKDLILVSGFNVYPNEIESVVASHPDVFEAAAVRIPDPQTGEAVRIYVVRRSENVSEADLIEFCRKQLTAYKVPKSVVFLDQLPKSNVGKILRRELRDQSV